MLSGKVFAVVFLFLLAFVPSLAAQTRINSSGTGGVSTIQGRIYGPSGMAADSQVTVRLESTSFPSLSLTTDQSGGYAFQNLAPGNYTVVVDAGEKFDVFREYVTIESDIQLSSGARITASSRIVNIPVYLQLKRSEQVKNQVVNARLSNLPKDAVEHYQKGLDFEQNGKTDEAVTEFGLALASYSKFPECYVEIGKISLTHAKLEDAATAFQHAIRLDPQNFDPHVNLGITLLNSKKFDAAEPELVTAAYLNKTAVTPHYYIGILYLEKNDINIAQKAFETAKSLPGGDTFPLIHRGLGGIYMKKGMNKQAVSELEKYLQLAPKARDADKIRQTITELKTRPEKLNVFS